MEIDKIVEKMKDYDNLIESRVEMLKPNSSITIYEGEFILKFESIEIVLFGEIQYDWFPLSGANFTGKTIDKSKDLIKLINSSEEFQIIIEGLKFGNGFITSTSFDSETCISGTLSESAIMGDKSIPAQKLYFSVPNMRDFHGLVVKKINTTNRTVYSGRNRLKFENDNYIILIDKCRNYKELKKELDKKGGYLILYSGELKSKKGAITYEDSKDIFYCLDTFLTFLNGRRTSTIFIHAMYEEEVIWRDFTDYHNDIYKFVPSWPEVNSIDGLDELFQKFNLIWKDKDDRDFLTSAIHWYVEANNNSGFSEGAIIMAQTALELLYNWFIVENKKLIIGKDSENINASNKIRLLLSQLNINYLVPEKFTFLQQFIDDNKQVIDGPDAVVQIRNAIVHSQEEKRRKLNEIHFKAKYEALQLCIWYIEMSLLAILDYKGKYCNRCSTKLYKSEKVELVPWVKKIEY